MGLQRVLLALQLQSLGAVAKLCAALADLAQLLLQSSLLLVGGADGSSGGDELRCLGLALFELS